MRRVDAVRRGMAALTFKVGGDTSGLKRALAGAKGALMGLGNVAKGVALGGTAAGIAGVTAAAVGLNKALQLGGRLSDVAANTGLLAGEALVLEQALTEAGIAGEKLQPTIQKMQKSIVEAGDGLQTPLRAFEAIGLRLEDLEGMKPGQQFSAITEALAGISDPAERSARAMQIFGRSGGELGALFSNPDALKNAATAVGSQAEMLNKGAGHFDRSADILGNIGTKLSGFFVGLASYINPVLLPVLEEMNQLDFSKAGAQVGEAVSILASAFKEGALPGLLKDGLLIAGKTMVNNVARGFDGIISVLMAALSQIPAYFAAGMRVVVNPKFWESAGNTLAAGIRKLSVSATQALPDWMAPGEKLSEEGAAKVQQALSDWGKTSAIEAISLGMEEMGPVLEAARTAMEDALIAAAERDDVLDVRGNRESMEATWRALRDIVEQRKAEADAIEEVGDAKGAVPKFETGVLGEVTKMVRPVVSSLARVGGAAIRGGRPDQMDRERNALLKKIAANTEGDLVARYA